MEHHPQYVDHRQDVMILSFRKLCNVTHFLFVIGCVMSILVRISVAHILLVIECTGSLMNILLKNSAAYSLEIVYYVMGSTCPKDCITNLLLAMKQDLNVHAVLLQKRAMSLTLCVHCELCLTFVFTMPLTFCVQVR